MGTTASFGSLLLSTDNKRDRQTKNKRITFASNGGFDYVNTDSNIACAQLKMYDHKEDEIIMVKQTYCMHQQFHIYRWKLTKRDSHRERVQFVCKSEAQFKPKKRWNKYKLHPILPFVELYDAHSLHLIAVNDLRKAQYKHYQLYNIGHTWPINYFCRTSREDKYSELIVCKPKDKASEIHVYYRGLIWKDMQLLTKKLCGCSLLDDEAHIITAYVHAESIDFRQRKLAWYVLYEWRKQLFVLSMDWNERVHTEFVTDVDDSHLWQFVDIERSKYQYKFVANSKYVFYLCALDGVLALHVVDLCEMKAVCTEVIMEGIEPDFRYDCNLEVCAMDIAMNRYKLVLEFTDQRGQRRIIKMVYSQNEETKDSVREVLGEHLNNIECLVDEVLALYCVHLQYACRDSGSLQADTVGKIDTNPSTRLYLPNQEMLLFESKKQFQFVITDLAKV